MIEPIRMPVPYDAICFCGYEGVRRHAKNLDGKHVRPKGRDSFNDYECPHCGLKKYDQWQSDIEGAAAEWAVAEYYEPLVAHTFYDHPDYEGDYRGLQVRHTPVVKGRLLVYETDPDDRPCILVTGRLPLMTIRGCLLAGEVKQHDEWWYLNLPIKLKDPCWGAPQSALGGLPVLTINGIRRWEEELLFEDVTCEQ